MASPYRAKDHGENKRRPFEAASTHEKAQHTKDQHDENLSNQSLPRLDRANANLLEEKQVPSIWERLRERGRFLRR
jgi:hypothetical protein